MNITIPDNEYYHVSIISPFNWNETIKKLIDTFDFNIAINYDGYWTFHGNDSEPYNSFEQDDLLNFMQKNGVILSHQPLVWNVCNKEALRDIANGFINADESIIAQVPNDSELLTNYNSERDKDSIHFWSNNSEYFLTTLIDYSGLIFISSSQDIIEKIKNKLLIFLTTDQLR